MHRINLYSYRNLKLGIKLITVEQIREKGVDEAVEIIEEQLRNCDLIYLTFDVDSMDPDLTSHGTGTPVPNGITPQEAKDLMVKIASNSKTACIEIVEVNPCLDEKVNTMAEVTLGIVEAVTHAVKNR